MNRLKNNTGAGSDTPWADSPANFLGPGDYDLDSSMPSGAEVIQGELAPSGQMVIPCGDFSALDQETQQDFIVSNPPYIPTGDIPTLQTEVSEYEPCVALDGGPDGLRFYRYLLEMVPGLLKPSGEMFLEIGFDQEPALTQLLFHCPVWASSKFLKDLKGNMRVWNLQKQ